MVLPIIFFASGLCIALLLFTKVQEMKTRRKPMLLRIISLGDERMKELSHRSAHFYADTKEDLKFFWNKQFPLHAKHTWNKFEAFLAEHMRTLEKDLRGTKLFKKEGDISEFFQNLSDKEIEIEAAERDLENSQKEGDDVK